MNPTSRDITAQVGRHALVVFTHSWWTDVRPPEASPLDTDHVAFQASRDRILAMEPALIVPGHAGAFPIGPETPR
jgi:hypothetical protein